MEKQYDIKENVLRLSRVMRRGGKHGNGRFGSGRVIAILMREDGIRSADLAERLDIRPSSLTEVLKKMEEKGLILRKKDENDSRVTRIFITETSKNVFAKQKQEHENWENKIYECLSEEEIISFCEISHKLADFLEKEIPNNEEDSHKHHKPCHRHMGRGKH